MLLSRQAEIRLFHRHALILWFLLLIPSLSCSAQPGDLSIKDVLAELPGHLPQRIFSAEQLAKFSEELTAAYERHPSDLSAAIPQLKTNFADANSWVRFESVIALHGLVMLSGEKDRILDLSDELATMLAGSDDYVKSATSLLVCDIDERAPDKLVSPLYSVLKDGRTSDQARAGAAAALMAARPRGEAAQQAIIDAVDDETLSETLRSGILASARTSLAGDLIVNKVISIANTSKSRPMRDTAIGVAEQIGKRALGPIKPKIQAILDDPKETKESKDAALSALRSRPSLQE